MSIQNISFIDQSEFYPSGQAVKFSHGTIKFKLEKENYTMQTIKTSLRSDKRKNPEIREYRILSNDECKRLSGHALIQDRNGKIANVKITSVKTWKTRSDIEVRCQFGLYEYFTVRLSDNTFNTELVTEVLDDEVTVTVH